MKPAGTQLSSLDADDTLEPRPRALGQDEELATELELDTELEDLLELELETIEEEELELPAMVGVAYVSEPPGEAFTSALKLFRLVKAVRPLRNA